MAMSTAEVMSQGMMCLVEKLGLIETEHFISAILQEKFDYTKWQRDYFDALPAEELHRNAVAYSAAHPYKGNAKIIVR